MISERRFEALAGMADRPGWEMLCVDGRVHRYPLRDLERHRPDARCGCRPRRERCGGEAELVDGGRVEIVAVYLHNAFDGRDLVEAVERGEAWAS